MLQKSIQTIRSHEREIILFLGLILISSASFFAGFIKGQNNQNSPLVIEKPVNMSEIAPEAALASKESIPSLDGQKTPSEQNQADLSDKNCRYVGSKNSDKFHLPTCQWAKRIKPENLVCFESIEEAKKQGRVSDDCVK